MELEQLIRKNSPYLRAHTTNLNGILAHLYKNEIFSTEEWQKLENKYVNPTTETTCDNLYRLLIKKEICQDLLRKILSLTENQHVIDTLWPNDGILTKGGQIFFEVPQRNELFTGRKNVLENLQARHINISVDLSKSISKSVLHGMGGLGKSSTALEFVYENKDKFSHIFWFRAQFEDNLTSQFTSLGIKLLNSENIQLLLESWFEVPEHQNWLIVLDNVENDKGIRKFLPRWGGHVLITSRNKFWPSLNSLPMPEFKDSVQMIEKILGKEDIEFGQLSKELGHLPLAIFIACQFLITNQHTSVQHFLNLFEKNCEYFMKYDNELDDDEKTIYSSVKITLDKIKSEDTLAYSWLQMVAYFSPDNINVCILEDFIELNGEKSGSDLEYLKTESLLLKYGIVKYVNKNNFSIHRLAQRTIELCNGEAGSSEEVLKSAFNFSQIVARGFEHHWFVFTHLIKTASVISIKYTDSHEERIVKLINFHEMIYHIYDIDSKPNLVNILPLSRYEEYYQNMKALLEPHFMKLVGLFRLMGSVYHDKWDLPLSLEFYLKALKVLDSNYVVDHEELIATLQLLAYVYDNMSKYQESIGCYQRIVSIIDVKVEKCQEKDFQSSDSNYYGPSYMNDKSPRGGLLTTLWVHLEKIGKLYEILQDWTNAKKIYERILAEKAKEFGDNDERIEKTIKDLVQVYEKMGDGDSIESQLFKLRLEIFKSLRKSRKIERQKEMKKYLKLQINKAKHACDECRFGFDESSIMFKCDICDDFDLCENCFKNDKDHKNKHSFSKF